MNNGTARAFEAVLQSVEAGHQRAWAQDVPLSSPIRSNPWFIPESAPAAAGERAGVFIFEDGAEPVAPAQAALPLPSADPADVAAELDLAACPDLAALARRRRRFAALNHPDRVESRLRAVATQRMTIANFLIDSEIDRRKNIRPAVPLRGDQPGRS